MNINKHGKQTKNKPTPAALFVRERSPTLVCPFNPFAPIFISFFLMDEGSGDTMRRTKKKREKKIKKNFRKRKMPILLNYCPYHMM